MLTEADRSAIVVQCPELILDKGAQSFFRSLRKFTTTALEKAYDLALDRARAECLGDLNGIGYAEAIANLKNDHSGDEDPGERTDIPSTSNG